MGWMPVCDQKPKKDGTWVQVERPMRGVRFNEMMEGVGYLAVRYDTARYIYEDVPKKVYDVLLRHRGASMYFRQQNMKGHFQCVDILKYDNLEAYVLDAGPEIETIKQIKAKKPTPMTETLFGLMETPTRKSKRSLKVHA